MKKLVEREHLQHIAMELNSIKFQVPSSLYERLDNLEKYVNENIIQSEKDTQNELKRIIYKKMKEAPGQEENKMWYDFYKSLDCDPLPSD